MPPESSYKSTLRPEDFASRPGFNISIVSIIVYLAGIAVHFFVLGGKQLLQVGGPTAGVLIGSYVGILMLATLVSYLAFAASPSRVVSAVVFCLSVPALVFADMKINSLADAKIRPEIANATPTPAPGVPGASPGAVVPGNPTYNATQRGTYVDQAGKAFTVGREVKKKAYVDAVTVYGTAISAGATNLTSKEAVTARRQVIATANQATLDYLDFITNQVTIYQTELQKTPLIPNDVELTINRFKEKNPYIADAVATLEAQKSSLKAIDDMMAMLEQSWGRWHVVQGKLAFQKTQDNAEYNKLQDLYKAAAQLQATTLQKLNAEQTALTAGGAPPAPGAATAPVPSPASPVGAPAPASAPVLASPAATTANPPTTTAASPAP